MTWFNEQNTVEQLVLDTLCENIAQEYRADYLTSHVTLHTTPQLWRFVPDFDLPRQHSDVLVESMVRDALIRLNPEIKAQPERAYVLGTVLVLERMVGVGPGFSR